MKEVINNSSDPAIQKEIKNIKFLRGIANKPQVFLYAQNKLLYSKDMSIFYQQDRVNQTGLPLSTENFYKKEGPQIHPISKKLPRILNIGSGSEVSRKLPAINSDLSLNGKPEVVADAKHLPFKTNSFSIVRASHILEHIDQGEITNTLMEWKRVLQDNGELHIAVPDAEITFKEIIDGQTPKGKLSFAFKESTAPLAQIYGLGYNNSNTDGRWLHKIIFSYPLLESYLKDAKFYDIDRRSKENDLAYFSRCDDDSQNHYSLLVTARNERLPHNVDDPLPEKKFREKCKRFNEENKNIPVVSFIIPVHNEGKNIKHLLASLESSQNQLQAAREFVFVVNGCDDDSEQIIRNYIPESYLQIKLVRSNTGILQAFRAGIDNRTLNGFVGKLDADILLHPHTLDLMQMFLVENPHVKATYSEPTPIDSQFRFNEAEHNPIIRSQRLYIHGRASLYRENPFGALVSQNFLENIKIEDMFLSFFFAYFYGLDSIAKTPNALIYSKTVKNLDDLIKQISRGESEMNRIFEIFPPFKIIKNLLEREIYPSPYKEIVKKAKKEVNTGVQEWTQLESTK